jgi:hypothetical protein
MPGATPRWSLPYPLGSETADGDASFLALATALDNHAQDSSGLFAARPVSTPGIPGKQGRYYYATDARALYRDNGTGWDTISFPWELAPIQQLWKHEGGSWSPTVNGIPQISPPDVYEGFLEIPGKLPARVGYTRQYRYDFLILYVGSGGVTGSSFELHLAGHSSFGAMFPSPLTTSHLDAYQSSWNASASLDAATSPAWPNMSFTGQYTGAVPQYFIRRTRLHGRYVLA